MSSAPQILVVNFHYVHPEGESYPGLHKRTVEELRHQFDALSRVAECIEPAQLEQALGGDLDVLPDRGFVLTFDDGLKDHVRFVALELGRRGWNAFFFVNTAPWKGELLDVHKLQLLNASVPFDSLYSGFLATAREELDPTAISMERVRQQYRYDDDDVARFKFAVNFALSPEMRHEVIGGLFETFVGDQTGYVENLYLTEDDCKTLSDMGHTIGCHSHRHQALSRMAASERQSDLSANAAEIRRVTGTRPRWISFPYGSKDAVDEGVLAECQRQGIRYGFTMQRGFVDFQASHITLNRVDTNDAPGGKSPSIGWRMPAEVVR